MPSCFSCIWLSATPWTEAHQAPQFTKFSRQKYWSELPWSPPGDLPDPGIKFMSLTSPALAAEFSTNCATWEAPPSHLHKHTHIKENNPLWFNLHITKTAYIGNCDWTHLDLDYCFLVVHIKFSPIKEGCEFWAVFSFLFRGRGMQNAEESLIFTSSILHSRLEMEKYSGPWQFLQDTTDVLFYVGDLSILQNFCS